MTERIVHVDPDPSSRDTRTVRVRPSRWYASIALDRDRYVDAEMSSGRDPELPVAFKEALDRVINAAADRIWYDGYQGEFISGMGPSWVTLPVQFSHVQTAVEALRLAELNHDYGPLHALADQLVLPVDEWFAPGERELIRGVDFGSPPGVFLRFLRAKAKAYGVRLTVGRHQGACGFARRCRPLRSRCVRCSPSSTAGGWTVGPTMSTRTMRPTGPGWAVEGKTSATARYQSSPAHWKYRSEATASAA